MIDEGCEEEIVLKCLGFTVPTSQDKEQKKWTGFVSGGVV